MEPKLAGLWSVYEQAKADYLAVAEKHNYSTAKAARFLRDTAENTLMYLENKNTDPIMMAELEATYQMAKSMAVSLTGGKKRKFDDSDMDRVRGTPRGPSNLPSRSRFGGQGKTFGNMGRNGPPATYADHSAGYGGFYADPHHGPAPRMNRGHSGIPFGYSRPVDSYQPPFY